MLLAEDQHLVGDLSPGGEHEDYGLATAGELRERGCRAASDAEELLMIAHRPVPPENRIPSLTWVFSGLEAARSYSLIRPPRTGFRRIWHVPGSAAVTRGAGPGSGTRGIITARRDRLQAARDTAGALGYQMKRRDDASDYEAPPRRRVLTLLPAPVARTAGRGYTQDEADYESALAVLERQRNALERSPSLTGARAVARKLGMGRNIELISL
jgi:hypothetical protein